MPPALPRVNKIKQIFIYYIICLKTIFSIHSNFQSWFSNLHNFVQLFNFDPFSIFVQFSNVQNYQSPIIKIVQLSNLFNSQMSKIIKCPKLSNVQNYQMSKILKILKCPKLSNVQNSQISKFLQYSNFSNSQICPVHNFVQFLKLSRAID